MSLLHLFFPPWPSRTLKMKELHGGNCFWVITAPYNAWVFPTVKQWVKVKRRAVFCLFFFFLGPHPRHTEVPRLGVESELQLAAYTTATATCDPSHICDLHHCSRQRRILNPLSEARDRTCILMHASQVSFRWAVMGAPGGAVFNGRYTLRWNDQKTQNRHCWP